jgi:hypothetical protein
MAEEKKDLFTAGNMAKEIGVSEGKVKKAIQELNIEPSAKKGACKYYSTESLEKVKAKVK